MYPSNACGPFRDTDARYYTGVVANMIDVWIGFMLILISNVNFWLLRIGPGRLEETFSNF